VPSAVRRMQTPCDGSWPGDQPHLAKLAAPPPAGDDQLPSPVAAISNRTAAEGLGGADRVCRGWIRPGPSDLRPAHIARLAAIEVHLEARRQRRMVSSLSACE